MRIPQDDSIYKLMQQTALSFNASATIFENGMSLWLQQQHNSCTSLYTIKSYDINGEP